MNPETPLGTRKRGERLNDGGREKEEKREKFRVEDRCFRWHGARHLNILTATRNPRDTLWTFSRKVGMHTMRTIAL